MKTSIFGQNCVECFMINAFRQLKTTTTNCCRYNCRMLNIAIVGWLETKTYRDIVLSSNIHNDTCIQDLQQSVPLYNQLMLVDRIYSLDSIQQFDCPENWRRQTREVHKISMSDMHQSKSKTIDDCCIQDIGARLNMQIDYNRKFKYFIRARDTGHIDLHRLLLHMTRARTK
jgi:hypothetical protein